MAFRSNTSGRYALRRRRRRVVTYDRRRDRAGSQSADRAPWPLLGRRSTHSRPCLRAHSPIDHARRRACTRRTFRSIFIPSSATTRCSPRELGLAPASGFRAVRVDRGRREGYVRRGDGHSRGALRAVVSSRRWTARNGRSDSGRRTTRWAICTGAGASSDTLREAKAAQVDTLIVGEGPHHTAVEAEELGIAVLYVGHYATETFGVRALGRGDRASVRHSVEFHRRTDGPLTAR